jgi:hypothetical protein
MGCTALPWEVADREVARSMRARRAAETRQEWEEGITSGLRPDELALWARERQAWLALKQPRKDGRRPTLVPQWDGCWSANQIREAFQERCAAEPSDVIEALDEVADRELRTMIREKEASNELTDAPWSDEDLSPPQRSSRDWTAVRAEAQEAADALTTSWDGRRIELDASRLLQACLTRAGDVLSFLAPGLTVIVPMSRLLPIARALGKSRVTACVDSQGLHLFADGDAYHLAPRAVSNERARIFVYVDVVNGGSQPTDDTAQSQGT